MVGLQHKGFEEPGGMSQVPLGWAGIGHALQVEVFGIEGLNQRLTGPTHLHQSIQE